MVVCEAGSETAKHTHLVAKLASGRELRFVDPRRFGRLSVAHGFEAGGSEPLEVQLDHFVILFHGRKTPIKSALLNQKLLRGVGNIYADESLFRAGIRPRRRAASLTREDLRRLYPAVQEVLREAIALGGSSVSDYVDADGEEGFFQTAAPGLRPGRRALPGLQDPDQARSHRGPQQPLLPQVSKVAPASRRLLEGILPSAFAGETPLEQPAGRRRYI